MEDNRWIEIRANSEKSYSRKQAGGRTFQIAYETYVAGGTKEDFDRACIDFIEHIVRESELPAEAHADVVQIGMVILLEALRDYGQKGSYVQTAATFSRQRIRELLWQGEECPLSRVPLSNELLCTECDPADSASQHMLSKRIAEVLRSLSYREREIIKLRYGLQDGYSYTLEEVGHVFHVTREQIRHIEAKAVFKLQQPSRAQKLQGFLP